MSHHDVFRCKSSVWSHHLYTFTGPTEDTPAAASEDSTPAAKSDSDSRDNDTVTSMLFGPSSKDKVANEAAAESTSEQSEQDKDKDNDKNDGGFSVAEKLGLIPSEEKEDETAAAAADADAGATTQFSRCLNTLIPEYVSS